MTIPVRSSLTLQLSPMQFSASAARARDGAERLFERAQNHGAAFVGGTESHAKTKLFAALPVAGRRFGYRTRVHRFGLWLAVDRRFGRVVERGFLPVLDAKLAKPALGGHQPRGIYWAEVESREFGTVVVGVGHWLTRRPDTAARRAENRRYTDTFESFLAEKGKGSAIAFLMGDTNDEDERDNVNGTQGQLEDKFATCWDDVQHWPSTNEGHTTIDVIARRKADKRVGKASKAVSWPNRFKDHFDTIVTYPVEVLHTRG